MARRDAGKWVARAAATGGGRSYRGQMPVKWYGSLALIVLVGIVSVVYSRYEVEHPTTGPAPTIGTKWYASLAVDICGTVQPDLATNPNSTSNPGIHTIGDGVIRIEPTKAADAGNNATLARFVADYPKFELSSTSLGLPGQKAYSNGEACPKQTPDAGKKGKVDIKVWPSSTPPGVNHPTTTTDPSSVKFVDGQLITIGFVPTGTSLPKPSATVIGAMGQAISQAASTTTTTLPVPATTAPTTGTTAPTTGTTAPTTATTAPTTATTAP